MTTYATLKSNIATTISRDDLTSSIAEAVQRACRFYERELFWFNRAEDSFISSSNAKQVFTISSTNTLLSVEQVVINYNSRRYEPERSNLDSAKAWDASNVNGLPSRWAFDPNVPGVIFDTSINVTSTISYTYLKRNATLSAAGDTNELSTNAPDLLEARACWWLYLTKIKNYPAAQAMKDEEMSQLNQLKGENTMKLASGKVTPTEF